MPYIGQTITDVFPTSVSLDTVTATTSLKTPLVEFTDGDNAFTISDGGNVAFTGTVSGGAKAQVQTHLVTTSSQSISASTVTNITGLNATITPSTSSKRIKVSVRWTGEYSHTQPYNNVHGLKRDTTVIGQPADAGDRPIGIAAHLQGSDTQDAASTMDSASYSYIDSPATTSSTTYYATFQQPDAGTLYNQRTVQDTDSVSHERLTSTMTLEEID